MFRSVCLLIFLSCSIYVYGQSIVTSKCNIDLRVERDSSYTDPRPEAIKRAKSISQIAPKYPFGEDSLMSFVESHLMYSHIPQDENIYGKVVVEFVVNEDGRLSDFWVAKGLTRETNEEAVRIAKLLPKFEPGWDQGRAVAVTFMLSIVFKKL